MRLRAVFYFSIAYSELEGERDSLSSSGKRCLAVCSVCGGMAIECLDWSLKWNVKGWWLMLRRQVIRGLA